MAIKKYKQKKRANKKQNKMVKKIQQSQYQ